MAAAQMLPLKIFHLGLQPYSKIWDLQRSLVKRRRRGEIPDTLLLLEHEPVITLGREGRRDSLLLGEEALKARGIELIQSDRGGDVTYHGLGQLIAYPILDLNPDCRDVGRFVWRLEQAILELLLHYQLPALRLPGFPGIWLREPDRKLAAIGARISRWITHHGLALNLNTEMEHFEFIVPCGLKGKRVSSLAQELERPISMDEAAELLGRALARQFNRQALFASAMECASLSTAPIAFT